MFNDILSFLIILFICINHNFHYKIIRIVYRDDTFDQIKINFHHGIRKKPLHE